jgi:hypothetical protein
MTLVIYIKYIIYINIYSIYIHFILSFKVMYLNACGWSVRPKHVAYIDETNKDCCG